MNDIPVQNESGIFQTRQTTYKPAGFAFAALGILFVLYQFVGGVITLLLLGGKITPDNVTGARYATIIGQFVFLLVPTIYLAKRQHGKISEAFQFRVPSFRETILAIFGMIALMQMAEVYLFFQSKIPLPEQIVPIVEAIKKAIEEAFKILIVSRSLPEMFFVLITVAITPALCEELMFRGLIQRNFSLAYGSKKGFIIAGTIFAFYHLNPFWLIPLIWLGIYFSFLRYRSQTLILPIIAHLINNSVAAVSVYAFGVIDSTTPTMFMGEQDVPSNSVVFGSGVFFAIIFFLIIVQYIKVTDNVQNEQQLGN